MGIKYDKIIFWGDVQQFFDGAHMWAWFRPWEQCVFDVFLSKSTKNIVNTWLGSM